MERTFDAERFERVLRHPDVEPYVSLGVQIPPMAPLVCDRANVCLMNEHGGFLCVKSGEGEYDIHTAFLPSGRGPHLVDLALEAREYLFWTIGARLLRTFVAKDNVPARRLALAAGFRDSCDATLFGTPGVIMTLERNWVCQ
jgi:hypothetical protein